MLPTGAHSLAGSCVIQRVELTLCFLGIPKRFHAGKYKTSVFQIVNQRVISGFIKAGQVQAHSQLVVFFHKAPTAGKSHAWLAVIHHRRFDFLKLRGTDSLFRVLEEQAAHTLPPELRRHQQVDVRLGGVKPALRYPCETEQAPSGIFSRLEMQDDVLIPGVFLAQALRAGSFVHFTDKKGRHFRKMMLDILVLEDEIFHNVGS